MSPIGTFKIISPLLGNPLQKIDRNREKDIQKLA